VRRSAARRPPAGRPHRQSDRQLRGRPKDEKRSRGRGAHARAASLLLSGACSPGEAAAADGAVHLGARSSRANPEDRAKNRSFACCGCTSVSICPVVRRCFAHRERLSVGLAGVCPGPSLPLARAARSIARCIQNVPESGPRRQCPATVARYVRPQQRVSVREAGVGRVPGPESAAGRVAEILDPLRRGVGVELRSVAVRPPGSNGTETYAKRGQRVRVAVGGVVRRKLVGSVKGSCRARFR
jgi:hypothetical protein